jgi:REP element-mobilizing transposase RayT
METTSYHHVCTEGLENCDLFIDREDFVMGFNKLAIAFKLGPYPVEIASAIEMANHIHCLPNGIEFYIYYDLMRFERSYSMYYSEKYGISKVFRGVHHQILDCGATDSKYLRDVIGYIYRNPVHHKVTSNPYIYEWSTFKVHFDNKEYIGKKSEIVKNLTQTQKQKILRTRESIPDDWEIDSNGMVSMKTIVNTGHIENIMRTNNSLSYYINKGDEDDTMECPSRFTDSSARVLMLKIMKIKLGIDVPRELLEEQGEELDRTNGNFKSLMERRNCRVNANSLVKALSSEQREILTKEMVRNFGVTKKVINRIM